MQINLHHSKTAAANLAQIVLNLCIDVVLIQEPYAFSAPNPVLAEVPPGFTAFHDLSKNHAYGAAILVRDSVRYGGSIATKHYRNFAACIDLKSKFGTFRFASLYLRPSLPDFASTVSQCFALFSSPTAVLGVDCNAKNQLWNSSHTDHKGLEFEQSVLSNKLNIMNVAIDALAFVPGGTAFVDVTLAGDAVNVSRWLFLPFASMSDHPFVYFEIESNNQLQSAPAPSCAVSRPVPRFSSINQQSFLSHLKTNLSHFNAPSLPSNIALLESQIDSLTNAIAIVPGLPRKRNLFPLWLEICRGGPRNFVLFAQRSVLHTGLDPGTTVRRIARFTNFRKLIFNLS